VTSETDVRSDVAAISGSVSALETAPFHASWSARIAAINVLIAPVLSVPSAAESVLIPT
jgi:hypothetical protein